MGLVVSIVLVVFGYWFWQRGGEPEAIDRSRLQTSQPEQTTQQTATDGPQSTGQYTAYSEAELGNDYDRHILFFHAVWCPECQAFKKDLLSGDIPDGVQILEVNYDTATALKKKYGVTLQSSFVEVDGQGELKAKWSGYGQGKTFADIEAGLSEG